MLRLAVMAVFLAHIASAQPAPAERPFKIIRLDPALDEIISPDAKLETLGEHFGLKGRFGFPKDLAATSYSAIAPPMSSISGRRPARFPYFWKTAAIPARTC
jgi:hypothetical protein